MRRRRSIESDSRQEQIPSPGTVSLHPAGTARTAGQAHSPEHVSSRAAGSLRAIEILRGVVAGEGRLFDVQGEELPERFYVTIDLRATKPTLVRVFGANQRSSAAATASQAAIRSITIRSSTSNSPSYSL